jgi:hypothetical protein
MLNNSGREGLSYHGRSFQDKYSFPKIVNREKKVHAEVLFSLAGFRSHILDESIDEGTVLLEGRGWDWDCTPIILRFAFSETF